MSYQNQHFETTWCGTVAQILYISMMFTYESKEPTLDVGYFNLPVYLYNIFNDPEK